MGVNTPRRAISIAPRVASSPLFPQKIRLGKNIEGAKGSKAIAGVDSTALTRRPRNAAALFPLAGPDFLRQRDINCVIAQK
jgi:hypothetical protein